MKIKFAALCACLNIFLCSSLFAAITNTPNDLIIPVGETFVISGSTSYINSVQVYGTLRVAPYDGGTGTGWLEINASTMVVGSGGKIDLDGKGYAAQNGAGRGLNGAGGSHAGYGGFESGVGTTGSLYGSLDNPIDMGSGGGNVASHSGTGGNGGGYLKINLSQDLSLAGTLSALGAAASNAGGGAGGSINIVAGAITGSGSMVTSGGASGGSYANGGGGGGRIAVNASTSGFTGAMTAYGGSGSFYSGAGTVYVNGSVTVDNNNVTSIQTLLSNSSITLNALDVRNAASLYVASAVVVNNTVSIPNGTTVTLEAKLTANAIAMAGGGVLAGTQGKILDVQVVGDMTVLSGASVKADALGYTAQTGAGAGSNGTGGSYGGYGGMDGVNAPTAAYGDASNPVDFGSGGGNLVSRSGTGGFGGGLIKLDVGGALTVGGTISALGGNATNAGAGSGGSVNINAGTLSGSGTIRANGGNSGGTYASGGGGGGRIAINTANNTFTGTAISYGGDGAFPGGPGTVLVAGVLTVNNNGTSWQRTLLSRSSLSVSTISIQNGSQILISSPVAATDSFTMVGASTATLAATLSAGSLVMNSGSVFAPLQALTPLAVNVYGSMTVAAGAMLNADGKGYSAQSGPGGSYSGTGGSYGGYGGTDGSVTPGAPYGDVADPADFGSGGGNVASRSATGGNGGGYIVLNVGGPLTVNGLISATGAKATNAGGGSGGSVNIHAGSFAGTGAIRANGGYSDGSYWASAGAGGRIMVDAESSSFTGNLSAYSGDGAFAGGAGTVYFNGMLTIDNNNLTGQRTLLSQSTATLLGVAIQNGSIVVISSDVVVNSTFSLVSKTTVTLDATLTANAISMGNGSVFTHTQGVKGFNLNVSGDMLIPAGAMVTADGKGYPSQSGPGGSLNGAGGSYGGYGGADGTGTIGASYGDASNPMDLGSGGGNVSARSAVGGYGGGLLVFNVGGQLTVNGVISANGSTSTEAGGGSGGGLNIHAGSLSGTGVIRANGGASAGSNWASAGGGGRIALFPSNDTFSGKVSAYTGDGAYPAGPGSVYKNGVLTFDNSGIVGISAMPALSAQPSILHISNGSKLISTGTLSVPSLHIGNAGTLTLYDVLSSSAIAIDAGGAVLGVSTKTLVIKGGDITVNGSISVNGMGYGPGEGLGKGEDKFSAWNIGGGGGSYGGLGGGSPTSLVYGSIIEPVEFGSGGGSGRNQGVQSPGGYGGGIIRLTADNLVVNGSITANGVAAVVGVSGNEGGGGAGGSIYVNCSVLAGTGTITATGGEGTGTYGDGGGGGGRIALYYDSKTFTGTALSGGGSGAAANGSAGTVCMNGVVTGAVPSLSAGQSFITSSQTFGSERYANFNIKADNMAFTNLVASGSYSGYFSLTEVQSVLVESTGTYTSGFMRGNWSATLDGSVYSGTFSGVLVKEKGVERLKGVITGQIYGSIECYFAELIGGSGVYSDMSGFVNLNRFMAEVRTGKIYLSGQPTYSSTQNYSSVRFKILQSAIQGNMTGDYAGPFNGVMNYMLVDDSANPFNREGYFSVSYVSSKGDAVGWSYAKRNSNSAVSASGVVDAPLYSIMQGALNTASNPPSLFLDLDKLDNSILGLRKKLLGPSAINPGQTISCFYEIKNESAVERSSFSAIVLFPPYMDFVAAADGYKVYKLYSVKNGKAMYIPFVRWDIQSLGVGEAKRFNFQAKLRIGEATSVSSLQFMTKIISIETADDIFWSYVVEDPEWGDSNEED